MSMPHSLPYNPHRRFPMRCAVQLYVAGKVFTEEVEAVNYEDARRTALARNPTARVVSVNAKF